MPYISKDIDCGTIVLWHKSEGETVSFGEPLFDIEIGVVRRLRRVRSARRLSALKHTHQEPKGESVVGSRSDVAVAVQIVASGNGYLRRIERVEGEGVEVGQLVAVLSSSATESLDNVEDTLSEFRVVSNLLESSE